MEKKVAKKRIALRENDYPLLRTGSISQTPTTGAMDLLEKEVFFKYQESITSVLLNDEDIKIALKAVEKHYGKNTENGGVYIIRNRSAVKKLLFFLANIWFSKESGPNDIKEAFLAIKPYALALFLFEIPEKDIPLPLINNKIFELDNTLKDFKKVYQTIDSLNAKKTRSPSKRLSYLNTYRRRLLRNSSSLPILLMFLSRTLASFKYTYEFSDNKKKAMHLDSVAAYIDIVKALEFMSLKSELDELYLSRAKPEERSRILSAFQKTYGKHPRELEELTVKKLSELNTLLEEVGVDCIVKGRLKSLFSYDTKMNTRYRHTNKTAADIVAYRLIVPDGKVSEKTLRVAVKDFGISAQRLKRELNKAQYIELDGSLTRNIKFYKSSFSFNLPLFDSMSNKISRLLLGKKKLSRAKLKQLITKKLKVSSKVSELIMTELSEMGLVNAKDFGKSSYYAKTKNLKLPKFCTFLNNTLLDAIRQDRLVNLRKIRTLFESDLPVTMDDRLNHQKMAEIFGLPESVKNQVTFPKKNGYQSIHYNFYHQGIYIEIQVRTALMHIENEYGDASHAQYKEETAATHSGKYSSQMEQRYDGVHPLIAKFDQMKNEAHHDLEHRKKIVG
jgi:ppGpp synthetase/RelA/SpoT-type nucleotidyltranferase